MVTLYSVALGFLIDLAIGDPACLPHPICAIGKLITASESMLRSKLPHTEQGLLTGGVLLWLCVVLPAFFVPLALLMLVRLLNFWLFFALQTVFCWQIFATKSLKTESMRVFHALNEKNLPDARKYVSFIVGRDTQNMTEEQVTRATVETIAENATDGVVAPMFYMLLGGPALGFLYKAVNTLDSMVGYKNDKYLYLGRFSARMDDAFNFIPARLTALVMILSAFIAGFNGKNAWKIFVRDRFNHKSPNSAQTESVCAGALGVQLAGNAYYFGKLTVKPTIGDALRQIENQDIARANRMLYLASALALLLCGGLRLVIFLSF